MTVVDYERKFDELGRFATHLIDEDTKKAQRFLGGLRASIRHILTGHGNLTYGETVRRAQGIAASQDMEQKVVDNAGKRKWQEDEDEMPTKYPNIEDLGTY
ncbi:hypothetical protein CASFOL_012854 [Castilleja foliolosa]|uniref:Retrotransposon gag domain-containing protein n=1 Tax=Castilleja foliolosa TaxID=1961234 RepID=A0ABD3DM24_9LAMI